MDHGVVKPLLEAWSHWKLGAIGATSHMGLHMDLGQSVEGVVVVVVVAE